MSDKKSGVEKYDAKKMTVGSFTEVSAALQKMQAQIDKLTKKK